MAQTERVSIVVPTYNQAEYLGACLDSIWFQDHPDLQIVVVDDASTDDTSAVLERFVRDVDSEQVSFASGYDEASGAILRTSHRRYCADGRELVVPHNETNQGSTATYNRGFRACTGRYCTYVASDDLCHPGMISALSRVLDRGGADFAYSDMFIVDDAGRILRRFEVPDYSFEACFAQWYLCGVSKLAADLMVQEYARYFGLKTACFRAGCISGAAHAGTELHGFLSYLMRCAVEGKPYAVYGHGGKQVRDNIHARDLVSMFRHFHREPRAGEVYNVGGGRFSNASLLEASRICERIVGREMDLRFVDEPRRGDHVWWFSDVRKFASHYPDWAPRYDVSAICEDIYSGLRPGGSRASQSRRVGHPHAAL